jgi:eukaryotic-like serine/threonine-protein kinase
MVVAFERLEEAFHEIVESAPDGLEAALARYAESDGAAFVATLRGLLAAAKLTSSPLDHAAVIAFPDAPIAEVHGYRVERLIGRGGSSWVYLADQDLDGVARRVALKILGGVEGESFLRRFDAEKRILAALEHPGIARLYDAGRTAAGVAYLAMEYVEGGDLLAFCRSRGDSIAQRVRVFLPVLAAVEYAHQNLVVHRDLKPANILVSAEGQPKLLDFGIAALLDPLGGAGAPESSTLLRALTPAYASPEQIRGERVTTATDVFSLGVVLYELLVGRPPHEPTADGGELERGYREVALDRPSAALRRRAERGGPTDAAWEAARAVEGDLDAIVMKALRSDPAQRYRSVAALAEDLRRHLDGEPISARPDTWVARAARLGKRHRLAVAASLAVSLAGVAGLALHVQRLGNERDRANAAAERARREAETSQRVTDLMASIFDAANPNDQPDRPLTGKEILERGAENIEVALADEPEVRERMHVLLGSIWTQVGEAQRAARVVEPAVAELGKLLGPDHPVTAEAKSVLARIRHVTGREEESKLLYQEALTSWRLSLGPRHAKVGRLLGQYGNTLKSLGEFQPAREVFEESLAILAEASGAEDPEIGKVWGNYGLLLQRMDDWQGAAAATERSLEILGKAYGRESSRYAAQLGNLAEIRSHEGRLPEALAAILETIRIFEKNQGPGFAVESMLRNTLGWTYMDLERPAAAKVEFERAVGAALERDGRHPNAAWPMRGMAAAEMALHRLDAAREQYDRALRLRLETRGERHWEVAQSLEDLAMIEGRMGRRAGQESYLRRALAVRRVAHDPAHPDLARALARLGEFLCAGTSGAEGGAMLDEALGLAAKSPLVKAPDVAAWTAARARCGGKSITAP